MKLNLSMVVLLAGLVAAPAVMARGPHHPGTSTRSQVRDDYRDVRRLENLLQDYDRAAARRHDRRIRDLDKEVLHLVRDELRETKREVRQDRRHGDRREARAGERMHRHVKDIRSDYSRLRNRMDRRALSQKRQMIVELIELARYELRRG